MRTVGIEFVSPGEMRFCELGPSPAPGPREILIRTHYSAITNGTERHALLGEHGWTQFPGRHGYQHVGTVADIGSDVRQFHPGDWVFYGQYVGHRGWHIVDVSQNDGSHLCIPLPASRNYSHFALSGVAGVSLRGVQRFRVSAGQNVWVVGAGLIGLFAAQAARAAGARVTVTDINHHRLEVAERLGIFAVLDAKKSEDMQALAQNRPYDCIIDASGKPSLLEEIHRDSLLAARGVIGLLAVRSQTTFHWGMLHTRESSIEVSCHFSLSDLRILYQLEPVISHYAPIDEAPAIYRTLRDEPQSLLGVIFDWAD
jgi:2-desacetyl-2-hydroxyethyl bacteriochlorophyllide A dehydrogenase